MIEFAEFIEAGIAEYYALVLFALAGMLFACSANHFALLFVSLELITVTFYVLTSFQRARLTSLEAGVKYLVIGRTQRQVAELEAELLRLNNLVRARREQLARLEACPNPDCECRRVWREVVDKKLDHQVGKIRKHVRGQRRGRLKPKRGRQPGASRAKRR